MRGFAALLLLALPAGAAAQQRVVSPAPDTVSVTVYRNPELGPDDEMNLDWLEGYALITETRTIDLPAGTSDILFEGVADTLIPPSVIVRGLPRQPDEKNYDARLLSAGSLIEASLGRQVMVRRTSRKTGKVTEMEALIRSGPGGVVLQTAAGFEALRCTGLNETLIYPRAPEGLSDKPTLAIRAGTDAPARATVQLSYLATQFDWQANYVASLNQDGKTLDLFAWLTLANGNGTSFAGAATNAIAGKPARDEDSDEATGPYSPRFELKCWPAGTTSDVGTYALPVDAVRSEDIGMFSDGDEIVVTGRRASLQEARSLKRNAATIVAEQEDLGDLKLYRVPEPVTVAANAQKQVALLAREKVPFERLYSLAPRADSDIDEPQPVAITLRMKNSKARRLGLPLPSGTVAVFERALGRDMLVGEPRLEDKAVGEDVELEVGESPDVTYTLRQVGRDKEDRDDCCKRPRRFEIEISNARPAQAIVEVEFRLFGDFRMARPSRKLGEKNGRNFWRATVPANGRLALAYTIELVQTRREENGEGQDDD